MVKNFYIDMDYVFRSLMYDTTQLDIESTYSQEEKNYYEEEYYNFEENDSFDKLSQNIKYKFIVGIILYFIFLTVLSYTKKASKMETNYYSESIL